MLKPFRCFLATGALVCTVAMFLAGNAFASSIFGVPSPYNVYALNNFTGSNSDVQGGLAAGGNITIGSYSVASNMTEAQVAALFPLGYSLVAGGELTATSGTLSAGNAYGSTTNVTPNSFNLSGGTLTTGGSQVIDFSDTDIQIDSTAALLAAMATTAGDSCSVAYGSTTTCTATANNLNIINVTDPTIFAGKTINITSTGANATLVINVAGTSDSLGGAGFTVFNNGTTVVFNYYQASALTLGSSSITGSVLAPLANVTSSGGGSFNGNLIAGNFSGSMEFHNTDLFAGSLATQAPEPGSMVLAGAGLTTIGLILRKRVIRKA